MFVKLALYLLAINVWTVGQFWHDKSRAMNGGWRVPEGHLLGLALIGGSPGAFLARKVFRHKTRKEPFSTRLQVIAVLQAGGLIGWFLLGAI
ncbi:DUF1294 domain-containing protein [Croceicoccus sediminis]|uniref:DUF1294 domain-containing protein n=1 Tax=Croceicoccus sediminis TaxID=2571150 RepID=UPI0011830FD9|nr:DUF1294 domain-containing protein [Croceicoccus sediminis]